MRDRGRRLRGLSGEVEEVRAEEGDAAAEDGTGPSDEEEGGLEEVRFAVRHMETDGSAPEAAGEEGTQRRGPREDQQEGAGDFSDADELDLVFEAVFGHVLQDFGRGIAQGFAGTRHEHESDDGDIESEAEPGEPFVVHDFSFEFENL